MRPLRNTDPSIFRVISIRTCGAALWMIPSINLRKLLGGIVARYQELLGIELYAYCFLGNHYHLLARAPRGNIDEFCENVNREIARRMNWKLKREGKFWSRRYDDIPVGREEDLLDAFLYVTTNPTRHGLLQNSNEWPGLHSFSHALDEQDRTFTFYHYSALEQENRVTRHKLKLSILPEFQGLSKAERRQLILKYLSERMETYASERKQRGEGFLGLEKILQQEPGAIPRSISKSKRPFCITSCLETWKAMRKSIRERLAAYMEASFNYRLGNWAVVFPDYSFKPPLHRVPREEPFKPMQVATRLAIA